MYLIAARCSSSLMVNSPKMNVGQICRNTSTKDIKNVFALRDNMVKHIQGWDITKRIDNKKKVYVRQFSGSKIDCMKNSMKPCIRENNPDRLISKVDCMKDSMKPCIRQNNPDRLILHVGTNHVPSNKKAKCIAGSIVSLAKGMKASKLDASIPRNDNWNNMVMDVNIYLKDLCESNNIPFISNTTINPKKHLNNSQLHLNPKGSNKLRDKCDRYLKGLTS